VGNGSIGGVHCDEFFSDDFGDYLSETFEIALETLQMRMMVSATIRRWTRGEECHLEEHGRKEYLGFRDPPILSVKGK
jgi:hypothetical protein